MQPRQRVACRCCTAILFASLCLALLSVPSAQREQAHPPPAQAPCAAAAALGASHAADCAALVTLALATGPVSRWVAREGWLSSDVPHCGWHGVACDAAGRVTAVRLDLNQLIGTLPGPALGALTQLRTLTLRHNGLRGAVPAELGTLRRLRRLSLSGNPLSGELPGALAGAAALRVLALSGTDVGGVLPAALATLPHLHTLSLRLTRLHSVAPETCALLRALPLCDLSLSPAGGAGAGSAAAAGTLPGCPGDAAAARACRVMGAVPPPPRDAARVTRTEVSGPGGMALPLAGSQGMMRNSSGRVCFGDILDVVLPYHGDHVAALAATAGSFPASFLPSLASASAALAPASVEAYATLANKAAFARFMAAHGDDFGAAAARAVAEPPRRSDFPCILKLAESSGGTGVFVLRGPRDYAKAVATVGAGTERVVQAWARGERQGTAHFVLLRGRALAAVYFEVRRPRGRLPLIRGGITGYERRATSPHAPLFQRMFAALNFTGLACVNYIVQAAARGVPERVTVLEVNPRVGSSLREAPADFRHLVLRALEAMEAEALPVRTMPRPRQPAQP